MARGVKVAEGGSISVGSRLLQARQEKGLTQKELAEPNLTASYISHIESGKSRPSLKTLAFLATRLGYPVSYFLLGEERPHLANSQSADRTTLVTLAKAEELYALGKDEECAALLLPLKDVDIDLLEKASLLYLLGKAQVRSGQFDEGARTLDAGRLVVKSTDGDPDLDVRFSVALGDAFSQNGRTDRAVEQYTNAYNVMTQVRDPLVRLSALSGYVRAQKYTGDTDAVLSLYAQQNDITQKVADPLAMAAEYSRITSEDGQNTARLLAQAQALIAFVEAAHDNAALHLVVGEVFLSRDDPTGAEHAFNHALMASRVVSDEHGVAEALCRLAELALARGHTEQARQYACDADAIARDRVAQGRSRLALAEVEIALGQQTEAEQHFREAHDLVRPTLNRPLRNKIYVAFSGALKEWGRLEEAYTWLVKVYSPL